MTEFVVHSRKGRTEDRLDSSVPTEKQARDLDYQTPLRALEPVRDYCGGQIALDPCTVASNPTGARNFFAITSEELALTTAWFKAHKSAGLDKYLAAEEDCFSLYDKKTDTTSFHFWRHFQNDGLRQSWTAVTAGGVFVNPPYGGPMRAWLEKIGREAEQGLEIIALIPASRFEQGYFQTEVMARANVLCCVRRRLAFTRPSTGEPAKGNPYSSLMFGYNVDTKRFGECFKSLGRCVVLSDPED